MNNEDTRFIKFHKPLISDFAYVIPCRPDPAMTSPIAESTTLWSPLRPVC